MSNNVKVKIEKGIPIPKGNGARVRWPWKELEVGDSFFAKGLNHSSLSTTRYLAQMRTGFTFSLAKENDGIRVWRTK